MVYAMFLFLPFLQANESARLRDSDQLCVINSDTAGRRTYAGGGIQ